jgi:uncharacterized phage infection (PIP) family protein YhgE
MPESIKDKISTDLQKIKEEGGSRTDKIRQIVRSAVSEAVAEVKEGSSEIRTVVKEAVSAVLDSFQGKSKAVQEDVTASIEGAIEAIGESKRESIAETRSQVKQLEEKLDTQEQELQTQVDEVLSDLQETAIEKSTDLKATLESAIAAFQDTEEAALMRKRYAQLKAKLAVLQADFSLRFGDQYDEVKDHLTEAKTWYDRTRDRAELETGNHPLDKKQEKFESQLGEVGAAIGRKERQVRRLVRELWHSITDLFQDK